MNIPFDLIHVRHCRVLIVYDQLMQMFSLVVSIDYWNLNVAYESNLLLMNLLMDVDFDRDYRVL